MSDRVKGLKLDVDVAGDRAVVAVNGELDGHAAVMLAAVSDAVIDAGCRDLVVDFGGVTFTDAAALGVLVRLSRLLRDSAGSLTIRSAPEHLRRVFDATRVSDLDVEETSDAPGSQRMDSANDTATFGDEPGDLAPAARGSNMRARSSTATVDAALRLVTALAETTVENADGVSVTLERYGRVMTVAASDDAVKEMDRHL